MKRIKATSLVAVFQVKDIEASIAWYKKWLGEPDIIPMENTAEYKIGESAWLQLSAEEFDKAGSGAVVIGVDDVKQCKKVLDEQGIETGDIMDYEVVLVLDIYDIDGNQISFAQEMEF